MTRRVRIVALSVWPGLAQIWSGQEVLGILLGAFFATTLNLTVIGRWIWREALPDGWDHLAAALAGITWLAGLAYTLWWAVLGHTERHRIEIDRLFREAHEAYLQGRWGESRRRIQAILAMDPSDGDALMQLGALYVRTNQPTLARRTFRQCLESKQGAKWRWEIHRELARLADTA
jgi:hypothetical protein